MADYNHPRINIQVGEEIHGNGEAYFRISGAISQDGADKQKQTINQLCSELQFDKSLIIVLNSESADATELKDYIDKVLKGEEGIFKDQIAKIKDDDKVSIKVEKSGNKVFIQIKPGQELEEMIWGPFQMVLDSGLQDLCQEQKNEFEISLKSNKGFDTLIEEFEKQEQGIGANALEQVAANITLHLDKNLIDSVMGIIKNFDPELAQIPPLLMLSYFKNFALDIKFNSPADLPPDFKKFFLTPKKYYEEASEKEAKNIPEEIQKLMDLLGGEFQIFATIENIAAIKIEGKGKHLTQLLQKFGGIIKL